MPHLDRKSGRASPASRASRYASCVARGLSHFVAPRGVHLSLSASAVLAVTRSLHVHVARCVLHGVCCMSHDACCMLHDEYVVYATPCVPCVARRPNARRPQGASAPSGYSWGTHGVLTLVLSLLLVFGEHAREFVPVESCFHLLHRLLQVKPHLHRDWAHLSHICAATGLSPPTSAPGLGSPLPHLHLDLARPCPYRLRNWTLPHQT